MSESLGIIRHNICLSVLNTHPSSYCCEVQKWEPLHPRLPACPGIDPSIGWREVWHRLWNIGSSSANAKRGKVERRQSSIIIETIEIIIIIIFGVSS